MKVLILAAGYGTRLEAEVKADTSGKYAHLLGVPKPLVPVDGRPLITHWIEALRECKGISVDRDVFVVVNDAHAAKYREWASKAGLPVERIINNGSTANENRAGAIADIGFAIDRAGINDHLLILGGDTLFLDDFSLPNVLQTFQERSDNLVVWYPTEDTLRTGILELNDRGIVTNFLEKPDPSATTSRLACPCFYVYRKETLPLFKEYLAQCKTLQERDAPGQFLSWLHPRRDIFALRVSGRFDIGGLDTYIECEEWFKARAAAAAPAKEGKR